MTCLFVLLLVLFSVASGGVGMTWDESTYFDYSDQLRAWASSGFPMDHASLERVWGYRKFLNPHPPFMRTISALSAGVFEGWLGFPLAYRLGHFVVAAMGLCGFYWLLSGVFGPLRPLLAVALILLQPRFFGELLLATSDAPVAIAWLVLTTLAWRLAYTRNPKSTPGLWIAYFLVLALAAASKLTGLLAALPPLLLFAGLRQYRNLRLGVCALVAALGAVAALSPAAWSSPLAGLWDYLTYTSKHRAEINVPIFYLGQIFGESPPWHYFPVMLAVTLPLAYFALLTASTLGLKHKEYRGLLITFSCPALFWLLMGFAPSVPKHDGLRQFASFLPMLAVLAWVGLVSLWDRSAGRKKTKSKRPEPLVAVTIAALSLCAVSLIQIHPLELSYYNSAIGSLRGAESAGLELTYYLEVVDSEVLAQINSIVPTGKVVGIIPDWAFLLTTYQAKGLLRRDLRFAEYEATQSADYVLWIRRRSMFDDAQYIKARPIYERSFEGVSLVKLVRQK